MLLGVKEVRHIQHRHLGIEVADGRRGNQCQIQIAQLQGFHHLALLSQGAVSVDFNLNGTIGLLIYQLGKFIHAKVKMAVFGQHMSAFEDNRAALFTSLVTSRGIIGGLPARCKRQ